MADAPVKYNDPSVLALADSTSQQLGLPPGLLASIITNGERSNSDQVSSAGARTVAQITPVTRKLAIDKYGVDPYLSTQNAIEVAGNLLKDSLDRNNGDVGSAIGEYIGGTNRSNWGKQTNAYIQRVTAGLPDATSSNPPVPSTAGVNPAVADSGPSTFDASMAAQAAGQAGSIANVYKAYQSGQMSPEDAKAFEDHVNSGAILLPQGASLKSTAAPAPTSALAAPPAMIQAYQSGQMSQQDRQDFESLVKTGQISVPDGVIGTAPAPASMADKVAGIPGAIAESITGSQRATPQTNALPDYTSLPELSEGDLWPRLKTAIGTMTGGPEEIAQVLKANFPGLQIARDAKGNYLVQSGIDPNVTVAIKPGFQGADDAIRGITSAAAFTPAARATSIVGGALASAGTQAAIEASKAATGGNFDVGNVVGAGALGAAAPVVSRVIGAATDGVSSLLGRVKAVPDPIAAAEGVSPEAANVPGAASPTAEAAAPEAVAPAPVAPAAPVAPVVPMAADDLAATARQAGQGDMTAKDVLAAQAAPDAKTVASAQRLGIQDYLQPDHVTTNQAYRELAQAVKSQPGSAARSAEMDGLAQVGQRASALIDELGGTSDLAALTSNVKSDLQASATKMEGQANDLWGKLRQLVPKRDLVATPATSSALQSMVADLGGEAQAMKALPGPASKFLGQMMQGEPVTYGYLDTARKFIGQAIAKGSGPFADMESGTLNHLYSTLSQDQEKIATSYGKDAFFTYQAAKYATQLQKGFEDDLSSLFGKNLDRDFVGAGANSLGGAVSSASKGSAAGLVRLLSAVPASMRENVTLSGIATTFRNAKGQGDFNFNSYSNWYEGLQRNRQAYAAVMANLPLSTRKQLAALYNVSKGVQLATRERITTGRILAVKEALKGADTLMGRMYEAAKQSAGRVVGAAVVGHVAGPGIGAAIGSALARGGKPEAIKAVDELISSPEFAKAVADSAKGQAPQAAKALGNSAKFRRFVAAVGSPAEMTDRQRWILQALEANNSQGNH